MSALGSPRLLQLLRERLARDALYGAPSYWDARAVARTGMARSLWPSNAFNEVWNERQLVVVRRALGSLEGRRVVDVGCGTGRLTRWLAEEGGASTVLGVDFSEATVEAACTESASLVSSGIVRYVRGDVLEGLGIEGGFDDALVLGCLSVACRDAEALDAAMRNLAAVVRPGGRVVLLEPIHRSPLLRRVLRLGLEEWIASANRAGLALTAADRMGFVPVRLVFSVREISTAWLRPIFSAGEGLLDAAPWLAPLADYKLLAFVRAMGTQPASPTR